MPTQTTLTSAEIDALTYDQARDAVRNCGHKGSWIANAKSDILKDVLRGVLTPTDAAVKTFGGTPPCSGTYHQPPAPAAPAPVSLDGVFGAAVASAVGAHLGDINSRLDNIANQIGSVPQNIEDSINDLHTRITTTEVIASKILNDLHNKVDAALQQGGTAAARVIAPVLGMSSTGTTDPVMKALEFYCAPGNSLKPVLVKGGPGSGKTFGARQHGKQFDRYIEIGISPDTEACDLLGFPTPVEPWIDGPLTEAFRLAAAGKTVCCVMDEILRAKAGARQTLLTPLSKAEINGEYFYRLRTGRSLTDPVTGCKVSEEILAPCSNLAIIATTNVGGKYDVQTPDPAEKDRFKPVHVEVEETKLRRVMDSYVTAKGYDPSLVDRITEFWKVCKVLVADNYLEQTPNTRIFSEAVLYSLDEDDVPHRILDLGLHLWVAETLDGLPEPEQCKRVVDALRGAFPGYAPQPTGDPTIDALIIPASV
jgi:predicted kinase